MDTTAREIIEHDITEYIEELLGELMAYREGWLEYDAAKVAHIKAELSRMGSLEK